MNISDIADWITILTFVFAACNKVWQVIREPVFICLIAIVGFIITLLKKVYTWLQNHKQ